MEDQNLPSPLNVKLHISFPKSSEDHRLQLVEINGAIFAFLHSPLETNGPINLNCKHWSLILLAPIRSKKDIVITGINVICLNDVSSEEGTVTIEASNKLVRLTPSANPAEKIFSIGKGGELDLRDDPGAFLYYFQLFNKIVRAAKDAALETAQDKALESISEAQKNFLISLCALAEKIAGKTANLTIHQVLALWDIPGITDNSH